MAAEEMEEWIQEVFRKQNIKDLVIHLKWGGVKGEERDFLRMIPRLLAVHTDEVIFPKVTPEQESVY